VRFVVNVSPESVDAGAGMTLHAQLSCVPACDLRGHKLLIKDESGAEITTIEITDFDGELNETRSFIAKAPVSPGQYMWLAVCPAIVKEGISYAEMSAPVTFTVKPHSMNLVVWDIPPAIVAGEKFNIKVGIKCSSECDLKNRNFAINNHEGIEVAAVRLSGNHWPGTGLHFAELELEAPAAENLYTWSVKCAGLTAGVPHNQGCVSFGIRVVGCPECLVTVETVDRETQTPLSGAHVVMHPYRAITNDRGVAEVRVPKGEYKLFVSQTNYLTFALPVEVTSNITAIAELDLEPVPERN
jgi:hypothetical protein